MSEPLNDPRVAPDSYIVRPSGYDDLAQGDKDMWCLSVTNGHAWGWSIRRHGFTGQQAMNRKGEWIWERRGSGHNKARRWPLEEAISIALKNVDTHRINRMTAAEASAWVAAREAAS